MQWNEIKFWILYRSKIFPPVKLSEIASHIVPRNINVDNLYSIIVFDFVSN